VAFCKAAVRIKPEDPGLLANLALAYCLSGRDEEARDAATQAVLRRPQDGISQAVERFVSEVSAGARRRPERLVDVFPNT
jgi:hypothetical protein